MPTFFVLSGADVGSSATLSAGDTLGRGQDAALRLRDRSISREHARVERRGSAWFLVDTDSRNGMFLDGRRVRELALEDGGVLRLGDLEVRVRLDEESATAGSVAHTQARPAEPKPVGPKAGEIELEEEIELEFDDEPAPARPPARPPRPAPREPAAAAAPSAPKPAVARPSATELARARAAASAAAPAKSERGILQYSRVADRPGLLSADLSQQGWSARLGLILLALALAAGLGYGTWRAVLFLRARSAPPPDFVAPVDDLDAR